MAGVVPNMIDGSRLSNVKEAIDLQPPIWDRNYGDLEENEFEADEEPTFPVVVTVFALDFNMF